MKEWIRSWANSIKPGKQRKYRKNAPLHIKHKMLSVNLSKELRNKYKIRNIPVRKGDKIKVLRGQFKKKTGLVTKVELKDIKVYIENVENLRKDGTKTFYPIEPSNIQIIELSTDDKRRRDKLKMESK